MSGTSVRERLRDPAYFALHLQAAAAIREVGDLGWYDSHFLRRVEAMRIGPGLQWGIDMGTLVTAEQLERVSAHVEDAKAKAGVYSPHEMARLEAELLGPAGLICLAQRVGEVACPVAPDQLTQPRVVKTGARQRQFSRREAQHVVQAAPICIADEAAVQVLVDIHRRASGRARIHLRPKRAHIGQRAQAFDFRQESRCKHLIETSTDSFAQQVFTGGYQSDF